MSNAIKCQLVRWMCEECGKTFRDKEDAEECCNG